MFSTLFNAFTGFLARRSTFVARSLLALMAAAAMTAAAQAQSENKIINHAAEKYAIAPGGVDMRTGQYVYSQTDLSIGPESGGIALTRTTPIYVKSHANPFANFSHNWDIMIAEKRIDLQGTAEFGVDFRISLYVGGRTFVFETVNNSATSGSLAFKSDSKLARLTYTGGSMASNTVLYTAQASDGTIYKFRAMGGQDCSIERCAYISDLIQPDGTTYTFQYAYNSAQTGNRARLSRVTSSRGYVMILEGSGSNVTKACVINTATTYPPATDTCPATPLATSTYAYTYNYNYPNGALASAIAADGGVSQFTYTPVSVGGQTVTDMAFIKPGYSTPWLTNRIYLRPDEEEVPHEITSQQTFADGRVYTYNYSVTPQTANKPYQAISGGAVTDAQGRTITVVYDWPVLPGSREKVCRFPPCSLQMPDDYYEKWTYQQTTGPVSVSDELGRETQYIYCDPVAAQNYNWQQVDRCLLIKDYSFVLPEGGTGPMPQVGGQFPGNAIASGRVEHDGQGNIIKTTLYPKPGFTQDPIITTAAFGTSNILTQDKPLWRKDANGNQTDWTYDQTHGGVLTETGPADDHGVHPQKRYSYTQRYPWLKNSGGTYSQAATPIWVLTGESFCRTSSWTGTACATANDEVVTAYDYGPNSGPNNLLLRGTAVTADGVTRRTCYGYDAFGRKISETTPNANLSVCP